MARKKIRTKSLKVLKSAKRYLVGGVNSPVRAFNYVGREPLVIKRGKGSKVYDYDGNGYIDFVMGWGSLILGHAFPEVINKVRESAWSGLSFGTTNAKEAELAQVIKEAIPYIEKVRFVNSGTEAVMGAVRLARGFTGRDKILKFAHSYHGHADYLLTSGGSGLATLNIAQSQGVPNDFIAQTIVISFGDKKILKQVFKEQGKQIAAVLFEPVGANYGVIPPDADFLKFMRNITKKYGTLLIADEVITGFRFNFGAFTRKAGIVPDLICLGKIIGGGLPIGAYAGPDKIMRNLAPIGKVYQASTFSGNPIVMQAGLATLKALSKLKKEYSRLENLTEYFARTFQEKARQRGIEVRINYFGSLFSFKFKHKAQFVKFYRRMLESGVFFAPSEFETNFLSFAHSEKDIDKTLKLASLALVDK